jgi:hypothetical protein
VATLSDLRTRDIARGGQAAPLASTLDALLVLGDDVRRGSLKRALRAHQVMKYQCSFGAPLQLYWMIWTPGSKEPPSTSTVGSAAWRRRAQR